MWILKGHNTSMSTGQDSPDLLGAQLCWFTAMHISYSIWFCLLHHTFSNSGPWALRRVTQLQNVNNRVRPQSWVWFMMSNGESWSSETLMTIDGIAAHFSTFCFARICLTSEAVSELKTAWGKDNARNQLHWKQNYTFPSKPSIRSWHYYSVKHQEQYP